METVAESQADRQVVGSQQDVQGEAVRLALQGLVNAALNPKSGSVNKMLEFVATYLGGFGCVLWQTTPTTNINAVTPSGELFVLAEHFPDGVRFAKHDLPIRESMTGRVLLNHKPLICSDLASSDPLAQNRPFIKKHNLGPMICVEIRYSPMTYGVLSVFGTKDMRPFGREDLDILEAIAEVIPTLYEASRERMGFQLLRSIDEKIRVAESQDEVELPQKRLYLREMCEEISKAFNALETSLCLNYPPDGSDVFTLQATVWPEAVEKTEYKPSLNDSVTAWILAKRKPVNVFHLPDYTRDSTKRGDDYRGMYWKKSDKFLRLVEELLEGDPNQYPPISFMGVPVFAGDTIVGVLRVSTAKSSPYFFSPADLQLLELVAAQIGLCWSNWLKAKSLEEESRAWKDVVDETNQLNRLVQTQLSKVPADEKRLLSNALGAFANRVQGIRALSIRLYDEAKSELYFEAVQGPFWERGPDSVKSDRLATRFPVGELGSSPNSIGDFVFREKMVHEATDLTPDVQLDDPGRDPSSRCEICAPILVGDSVFGVLDAVYANSAASPEYNMAFAELLGQQLGLYLSLSRSIKQLRQAEQALRQHVHQLQVMQVQQQRTFEDLSHQLKGPLRLASLRAHQVVQRMGRGAEVNLADLLALRGLMRKAQSVASSLRLLAELERNQMLTADLNPVCPSDLVRVLIQAADDHYQAARTRNIRIHVNEEFEHLVPSRLRVDRRLLEQAIYCLVDNATKYSYDNSRVRIEAGLTGKGRFYISVSNVGISLRRTAISDCKLRGWRSDDALNVAGDGSGIGLWIVDHIMKAHRGELVIEPTTADAMTIVKLIFPYVS